MTRRNGTPFALLILLLPFLAFLSAAAEEGGEAYDLDRCIRTALEANRGILLQEVEEDRASQRVREAWAGALPQIGLEGTLNRNFKRPSFFFGGFPGGEGDSAGGEAAPSEDVVIEIGNRYDYTAALSLRQPLWVGGKVGAALKAAKIYDRAVDQDTRSVEREVVLQVRRLFYTALLAAEEVEVYRSALEQAERNLEIARLRRDRGLASDFELLRAEVAVSEAEPPLIEARNRVRQSENDLKIALGVDLDSAIRPTGDFRFEPVPPERMEALAERAVEARPDRRSLALQADLLAQNVRVNKADRWPGFYLIGSYQFQGSSDDLDFQERERTTAYSGGLLVSYPIWTSGATTARIRQAEADRRAAIIRLEQLDEEIRREVRSAAFDMESATDRAAAAAKTEEQARRAYEIAETSYENGLLTQVELLDARLALTRSRVARLRALHDALAARAAWERAVGLSWSEEGS
ncbi:MAG: TolC family protein [Candidatus Eisenbacteria bacterium]|nr:TolC family protein [Candidatus Eisenbacteria bacterium]